MFELTKLMQKLRTKFGPSHTTARKSTTLITRSTMAGTVTG